MFAVLLVMLSHISSAHDCPIEYPVGSICIDPVDPAATPPCANGFYTLDTGVVATCAIC